MAKLTRKGYEKQMIILETEKQKLNELARNRSEAYSRDGDGTHDNPMFHLLTREYEVLLNKVKKLEEELKNATIIEDSEIDCNSVGIGSVVEVAISSLGEPEERDTLQIVDSLEASFEEKKISFQSPVGALLLGLKEGDERKLKIADNEYIYKVISIKFDKG